jgi:hypothetical protein
MIVHDLDVKRAVVLPSEAYASLIVDADAVLAFSLRGGIRELASWLAVWI